MSNPLRIPRWSPYAVGVGIGVLSWATFYFMDKPLGASTSMVNAAGAVVGAVAPEHAKANEYLASHIVGKPVFDWQMALVLTMALGAFLAAALSRSRRVERVPSIWASRFGPSRALRYAGAFLGGVILIIGARMAGGCTSGHGISGGLQLAVSSWVFIAAMFIAGIGAAQILYTRKAA
jgi:uncharacterized membrane protein YedE/YeeE